MKNTLGQITFYIDLNLWVEMQFFPIEYRHNKAVRCVRYGLKRYTDIKGEQKARLETNYIMDMIEPAVIAGWIATLTLGIATSWLGTGWILITGVVATIVATITSIVVYIVSLVQKTQEIGIQSDIVSSSISGAYVSRANYYLENKNLETGSLQIFKGTDIYAAGKLYEAQSAGSNNSYQPTKAYNPSESFTGRVYADNYSKTGDYTQGRAHYTSAGNDGYNLQNAKNIPLASIQPLNPDIEYKKNAYKHQNERLLRAYSELANNIGTDDNNDSSAWLQSFYNMENDFYKDIYYTYTSSKDVIERLSYYRKALRAELDFFSKWQAKRQEERSTHRPNIDGIDSAPIDDSVEEIPQDPKEVFNLWLQGQLIAELIGKEAYYELESREFLEYKYRFFENLDISYFINACMLQSFLRGCEEKFSGASGNYAQNYTNFLQEFARDNTKAYLVSNYSGITYSMSYTHSGWNNDTADYRWSSCMEFFDFSTDEKGVKEFFDIESFLNENYREHKNYQTNYIWFYNHMFNPDSALQGAQNFIKNELESLSEQIANAKTQEELNEQAE